MAKGEAAVYRPAEACRIAEVAPYVLRYWETEFSALSEGKDKGATKLYTARDVKIISRIRELLYDEGFTVAGAKKRLDAEIAEGRFDDGLAPAPPIAQQKEAEQRKPEPARASAAVPATKKPVAAPKPAPEPPPVPRVVESKPPPASTASSTAPGLDRKSVVRELRDIVRLLDRSRAR